MSDKKRKGLRNLTVNGAPWTYIVGKSTVAIYDPEDNRYFPRHHEVLGDEITTLNPATILNYILVEILGDEPVHEKCTNCSVVKADGHMIVNPFAAEINEDFTKYFYCNECVNVLA